MPRILVFQHVAAEPLGTLNALIRARGHRIRFVNFERHPDARPRVERYRGLVVLGGPMNVEDAPQRPHLETEITCIRAMLELGRPVLGICLGAQLLARALGAEVRRNEVPEIGWYRWDPTPAGKADPVLAALPAGSMVFQWHHYTFEIPPAARHLGATATCRNQAFCWRDLAWGLQFHLELDAGLLRRWLGHPAYRAELARSGLPWDAEAILREAERHLAVMQDRATEVFGRFLDRIGRPARRRVLASTE
ncbi:MAG: GMP synthase [Lysobacteraceae bacterium]|nr:MAG: GMP synthase [Xanthomonadaceae bacterium]